MIDVRNLYCWMAPAAVGVLLAAQYAPAFGQTPEQLRQWCFAETATVERAERGCRALIGSDRESPETAVKAFNFLARAYKNAGQPLRAVEIYTEALKRYPDSAIVLGNRALTYVESRDFGRAIQDYDTAFKLEPNDSRTLRLRCDAKMGANRLEEALADCNEGLRRRPNDFFLLESRGHVYLKQKQYRAAIADYNAALQLEPDFPVAVYGRGLARRRSGDVSGGDADIAAARKEASDIDQEMATYGLRP